LEELVPHLGSTRSTLPDPRKFVDALVSAELRTAFLITGDLLALIENIALEDDPSLVDVARSNGSSDAFATVLNHPRAGEIIRFALTPAATALRVRLGTVWSGTSA
jgi:hypothetical protein